MDTAPAPDQRMASTACDTDFLVDLGKSATTIAHRWLFVLAATWLLVLLPLPNWMDKITRERFSLWIKEADLRSQVASAREKYLLALLSKHIDPVKLERITTERIFTKPTPAGGSEQPGHTRVPSGDPPAPLKAPPLRAEAVLVSGVEERPDEKTRRCRELIEEAAKESAVQDFVGELEKNRRAYNLLLTNALESGRAIGRMHREYPNDQKGLQEYAERVKNQYEGAIRASEDSKSKLEEQKPGFDIAIPGFLGLPLPGNISAPAVLCLWCLASLALIIYLVEKRGVALELCRDLLHQSPAATRVALQHFWWWLLPLPRGRDDQEIRQLLGWQGRYRTLVLANVVIVGSLLAAHAYILFIAVHFREWTAYFMSIPPSANRVADSVKFGFVPVVVLATLACAVSAVIYSWASLPDQVSSPEGLSKGRRRFVRLALLAPLVGAAAFAVQRELWAQVGYETLRKWWRRPRYRRRQTLTPAPGLEPGFYVSERDLGKEHEAELILHYVWKPQQFSGQLTASLKSLLARRRQERWPQDRSWATNPVAASTGSRNLSTSDDLASLQLRHRKKRRPDPAPLSGSMIRKASGINVATLEPVTLDDEILSQGDVRPRGGSARLQSFEGGFRVQLATASHSLEQHALTILMEGGDPRQAIACVEMAVRLDRDYKARMNRPLSIRLYDLLVGLSLRFSDATMDDILDRIEWADDASLRRRAEHTWRQPEWGRRWRSRKQPIRWAGVMLPPVAAHQIRDLPPLSPAFPSPAAGDKES